MLLEVVDGHVEGRMIHLPTYKPAKALIAHHLGR